MSRPSIHDAHARDLFEHLVTVSPVVTFRADGGDLSVTYASPNAERVLGYRPDELVGARWIDRIHPDDREPLLDEVRRAIHDGVQALERDHRFRHKDGTHRWLHTALSRTDDGALLGFAVDVTERKRREIELGLLLSLTRAISEAPNVASALNLTIRTVCEVTGWAYGEAWTQRRDGSGFECRPAWHEDRRVGAFSDTSAGMTLEPGAGLAGSVWSSKRGRWARDLASDNGETRADAAAEAGLSTGLAVPVLAGDEVVAVLAFYSTEPREEDDNLMKLISSVAAELGTMIERKRAEEERDRFFNQSLDMLCIAGFDGYFKRLNPAWEEVLGYPVDELLARPFVEFVHPEDRERTLSEADRLAQGHRTVAFENRYRHADGSYRWFMWNATSLSEQRTIYAIARDISDRKQLESDLTRWATECARSNRELEQFAYIASHDLQEPLRIVASYVQLLHRRYRDRLGDDADEFIGFILDGVSRMKALINDLLAYSRVDSRSKVFQAIESELALDVALANLRAAIEESGASVSRGPLPAVHGEMSQLTQLFQNLIGNAIKFRGPERPEVRIDAIPDGTDWRFSVRDNGIGIEPEYRERIFAMFERLHGRDEYPGTGIGLAICKKIVERHGGRIWVESEPARGTTFSFMLPRDTESEGQ